jgi:membrane protease subunit HflK
MGIEKLIDLIIQFLEFFRFCTIIDCYERGVRLRFGKFVGELEPGLHWQWPFNVDNILNESVVTKVYNPPTQAIITGDGKTVIIGIIVAHSIRSIKKALLEVSDVHDAVRDACIATVAEMVKHSSADEIVSEGFSNRLTIECRKRGWRFGVEIESVRICELTAARTYRVVGGL